MKILTRYIFKEMLVPTTLGFIFYTFLILTRQLFDIAGLVIKRSLPTAAAVLSDVIEIARSRTTHTI